MIVRLLLLSVFVCSALVAQETDVSAKFSAGSVLSRITLNVGSPIEVKDRIEVNCSAGNLEIVLLTPAGQRVNSANALANGFEWSEQNLGQPDWGKSAIITFGRSAAPGAYRFEVSGRSTRDGTVEISFFSPGKAHAAVSLPGTNIAPPVRSPQAITLNVKEDTGASVIDVLVADTSLQIALDMPNGHTITSQSASAEGLEWRSTDDPRTERTEVAGLLFPQAGRHHLIYFKRVVRGAYTIRVLDGATDFRALFLPYEAGWERYAKELNSRRPEPGRVTMRVFGSLQSCAFQKCFVGDALDIGIALEGDVAPATLLVEAFYGSPVHAANLVFLPKPDGTYHATLTAAQPGPLHLTVRAAGETSAGVGFREERQIPEIIIATRPAPARVEQLVRPAPPVPKEAQAGCRMSLVSTAANRVGRIAVSARIDEAGRAHEVKILRSNNPALDRDAIEYVEQCGRYQRGAGLISVEVNFRAL